jgi:hypothetical protein
MSPAGVYPRPSAEERFWSRVSQVGECWEWTGPRDAAGYGKFSASRHRTVRAHRFAYEDMVGVIPEGLVIDHLCRNRSCVNPGHLEPVTDRVNVLRSHGFPATYAARTHCNNGHEFTPENTRFRVDGGRRCRACMTDLSPRYQANRKQRKSS